MMGDEMCLAEEESRWLRARCRWWSGEDPPTRPTPRAESRDERSALSSVAFWISEEMIGKLRTWLIESCFISNRAPESLQARIISP